MRYWFSPGTIMAMTIVFLGVLLQAQQEPPAVESHPTQTCQIPRIDTRIQVDGRLEEPCWDRALKMDVNIEVMPGENIPAPVVTECYLFFNDHQLLVGFKAYDPEPEKIRAFFSDRDEMWRDDFVGIILDTFNDENRAFSFMVNPLGVQGDEVFSDGGSSEDTSWDAIWESGGQFTDYGYSVEMAIPFRSLQFQPSREEQTWGCAPMRNYPRDNRHQITNFTYDRSNPCLLCQSHKIRGFKGATPGRNIELDPTLTGLRTDEREDFPAGDMVNQKQEFDVGISGQWGFTNNLTLSAAVNPDFSQVEADAAQLDVNTQFALYYPEKRPFFLEGRDFFQTPTEVIYTRSIADPLWGMKISGKEGKNAIGFFSAQDTITNLLFPGSQGSETGSLDQRSYGNVFRYRRDMGNSSTLGIIVSDREGPDYYNRLGGIDGLIRVTKSDRIQFQLLGTSTRYPDSVVTDYQQPSGSFGGYGIDLGIVREKKHYFLFAEYQDKSPDFRADLGFVPRVDFRTVEFGGGYMIWGKKDSVLTQAQFSANYDHTWDHDGNLLERELEGGVFAQGPMQSMVEWTIGGREKTYQGTSFEQFFNHLYVQVQPVKGVMADTFFSFGDEIDYTHVRPGKYLQVSPELNLNLGRRLKLGLVHHYYTLNVDQENLFVQNISEVRLVFHLTRKMFLRAITQYEHLTMNQALYADEIDPLSKELFLQLLFSYKLNPRTVLFLGYTDNRLALDGDPLTTTDRTVFFKIGYALNL